MRNIAIVDDNQHFLDAFELLVGMIPDAKLLIKASSGREFLDNKNYNELDIAFIDLNMPVMDGIELTRLIIKNYLKLKVIAISSTTNDFLKELLKSIGAFDLVDKDELDLKRIRELIFK